jgi:23S rRNA U2552 (ribose-2'-O)-methylase RlmE/FtsJ
MKSLLDLYQSHAGKVSDKWSLYLREYDRLFAPYRDQSISMLEIGVQNGGSLEIWSQYFTNANKFIGCDINPDCANLHYEDPRIDVIVGDATTTETQARVLAESSTFDLIIEDGSHTSSDIVKAFCKYFPALKNGGLFVVEDLHCSYWKDYEGGIFNPFSSVNFFKLLIDILNHEHWGVDKNRVEIISGYKQRVGIDITEETLSQIDFVEFKNSMCIIGKRPSNECVLGSRVVGGASAAVYSVILKLGNTNSSAPSQNENVWSNYARPPLEDWEGKINENNILSFENKNLKMELTSYCHQKENLEKELEKLREEVIEIKQSKSWRLIEKLRKIKRIIE